MKRVVVRFAVASILSIQFLGLLMPTVTYAVTNRTDGGGSVVSVFDSQSQLSEAAKLWSEAQAFSKDKCWFQPTLRDEDITNVKWFSGDVNVGLHVEAQNGEAKCDNSGAKWVSHLLNALGYSNNYGTAYDEIKNHHAEHNPTADSYINDLKWFVSYKVFGMASVPTTAPDRVTYYAFSQAFTSPNGCKAIIYDPKNTDATRGMTLKNVYLYDTNTNTVKSVQYAYRNETPVTGYGLPGDGRNDGKFQCSSIANALSNRALADSVVAWTNAYQASTGTRPDTGTPEEEASVPASCETRSPGVISWITCGVIGILDDMVSWFDGQIQGLLSIKREVYTNSNIKNTWGVIRNIALLLLVPIMMVMVIGTALDFGPFDPYTVRKALPRMIAAVLFISLSWQITTQLINLANAFGSGILGLLTTAFGINASTISLSSLFTSLSGGGLFTSLSIGAVGVGGALLVGAVAPGIVLSYAFVAAVSLFIGFLTLVVRQIILIGLILFAPVAILVWIFPGNDKFWKIWWESFSKLLLMFPIIMALIALGRIFASVIQVTGSGDQVPVVNSFLKITAYLAPYFFIPATFKLAGGLFATVAGITNDKSKGLFDRQRKYRAEKRAYEMGRFKSGERGVFGRGKSIGEAYGAFTEPGAQKGKFLMNREYREEALDQQRSLNVARHMKSERFQTTQENDAQNQALSYLSEDEARANMQRDFKLTDEQVQSGYIEKAIRSAKANGGFSKQRQIAAARQLFATGTGYKDIGAVMTTLSRVAGDNDNIFNDIAGYGNAITKQKGRNDLAPGMGKYIEMFEQVKKAGGYQDYVADTSRASVIGADMEREAHTAAALDTDAVSTIRMKKGGLENTSKAVAESFEIAQQRYNDASLSQAQRDAARDQMVILKGNIDKVEQAFSYGSTGNVEVAGENMVTPTSGIGGATTVVDIQGKRRVEVPVEGRQAVTAIASAQRTRVNPTTGQLEIVPYIRNGKPDVDKVTGKVKPLKNADYDERAAELARRHGSGRRMNPDDPDY